MKYRLPFTTTWPSTPLSFWTPRLAARPLTMMAGKYYRCQMHTYHYLWLSYLQHKHNILTLKQVYVHIFHYENMKKKKCSSRVYIPATSHHIIRKENKALSFKCSWPLAMQLNLNKTNTPTTQTHSPPFSLQTRVIGPYHGMRYLPFPYARKTHLSKAQTYISGKYRPQLMGRTAHHDGLKMRPAVVIIIVMSYMSCGCAFSTQRGHSRWSRAPPWITLRFLA